MKLSRNTDNSVQYQAVQYIHIFTYLLINNWKKELQILNVVFVMLVPKTERKDWRLFSFLLWYYQIPVYSSWKEETKMQFVRLYSPVNFYLFSIKFVVQKKNFNSLNSEPIIPKLKKNFVSETIAQLESDTFFLLNKHRIKYATIT